MIFFPAAKRQFSIRKFLASFAAGSSDGKAAVTFRNRSHLTEMLWRERYAKGIVGTTSAPNLQFLATKKLEESPKRMHQSYCEITLPFRTDLGLREDYVNSYRGLRFGRVLEDLDALAASIAYRHCQDRESGTDEDLPLTIVTASVDRIEILNHLRPDLVTVRS
jgi:hypothetical protein